MAIFFSLDCTFAFIQSVMSYTRLRLLFNIIKDLYGLISFLCIKMLSEIFIFSEPIILCRNY